MRPDVRYEVHGHVGVATLDLFGTEDHREGVRSFLEKRTPRYVGR
jgi:1,4-dihydroxy-2-naphthoyl-CoA synthase